MPITVVDATGDGHHIVAECSMVGLIHCQRLRVSTLWRLRVMAGSDDVLIHPLRRVELLANVGALKSLAFSRRLSFVGLSALVLSAFTATWGGVEGRFGPVADGLLLVSLLVCGLRFASGPVPVRPPLWLWVPAFAVLGCMAVQRLMGGEDRSSGLRYQSILVLNAHNETKGLYWLVALLLVPAAIIICTAMDLRTPRFVVGAYLSGVCVSCAVAISDLAGLTNISASMGLFSGASRQYGLSNHPNTLGLTCAITIPFAMYLLYDTRYKWMARLAIALLFGGVFASGSRGAQVVAPLAAVVTVMLLPNRRAAMRQLALIVGAGVAAGAIVGLIVAPERLAELVRFDSNAVEGAGRSDAVRALVLGQAIDDFQRFPFFGVGLRHVVEAHDIYVQLLAAGGLTLLLAMVCYWAGAIFDAWGLYKSGESLGLPLMVSVCVWLALGVVENHVTDRYLYYGIGCVAALVAVKRRREKPGGQPIDAALMKRD